MDFHFTNHGHSCTLQPLNQAARMWCLMNLGLQMPKLGESYLMSPPVATVALSRIDNINMTGNWL